MIMTLHKIHSSILKIAKKEECRCHRSASFIFNVIHIFIKSKANLSIFEKTKEAEIISQLLPLLLLFQKLLL